MIVWTSLSHHKKTRVRLVEFYGSYSNSRKAAYTSIYWQASDGAESPEISLILFSSSFGFRFQQRNFAISLPLSSLPYSFRPLLFLVLAFHFPELISQRELKISKSATIKRF